jgi:hypothetical protein
MVDRQLQLALVFYINIPVGIASIIMTSCHLRSAVRQAERRVTARALACWRSASALQIVLDKGQQETGFRPRSLPRWRSSAP